MGKKLTEYKPVFFKTRKAAPQDAEVIEAYDYSLVELFFITHPQYKKEMPESQAPLKKFLSTEKIKDVWIYFPWCNKLVHTVEEKTYFQLRTARNKNIITEQEQKKYRDLKVGIIGLSIGSVVISQMVYTGGPQFMKLSDYDEVEVSNLNRMNATLLDIGENKTLVAARKVWEIDPFADLSVLEKGVDKNNLEKFILGEPQLDVFIDAMDSLELKIQARIICRKHGIPVVMATSNADGIILDVERFDQDKKRELFHGRIGDIKPKDFAHYDYKKWLELALKIVDFSVLTPRMQQSIGQIGKTISSVPQLASTVNLGGVSLAYVLRKIANDQHMPSGRYLINMEKILAYEK